MCVSLTNDSGSKVLLLFQIIHAIIYRVDLTLDLYFEHLKCLFLEPSLYQTYTLSLDETHTSGMAGITWHYVFKFIITGAFNEQFYKMSVYDTF